MVEAGTIHVSISDIAPLPIQIDRMMVGTLEYFLTKGKPRSFHRLFDLYVESLSQAKEVSFETIDDMITQFDFGFESNRFLAHLIEFTNERYLEKILTLPKSEMDYQHCSQIYARLALGLNQVWGRTGVVEIRRMAQKLRNTELYEDGAVLLREQQFSVLDIPATPMVRFVQEFKKGSFICEQGDPTDEMYALLRGRIGVLTQGKYIAWITQAGEAFGELSLFLDGKRTATLVAEEDSALYLIRRDELKDFHSTHPNVFLNIARTLAGRVAENIGKIDYLVDVANEQVKSGSHRTEYETKYRARTELTKALEELAQLKENLVRPEVDEIYEQFLHEVNSLTTENQ